MVCRETRDWPGVGDSQSWDNALRGICNAQCMLYSVLTLDHGME